MHEQIGCLLYNRGLNNSIFPSQVNCQASSKPCIHSAVVWPDFGPSVHKIHSKQIYKLCLYTQSTTDLHSVGKVWLFSGLWVYMKLSHRPATDCFFYHSKYSEITSDTCQVMWNVSPRPNWNKKERKRKVDPPTLTEHRSASIKLLHIYNIGELNSVLWLQRGSFKT